MSIHTINSIIIFAIAFLIDMVFIAVASVVIYKVAVFFGLPKWLGMLGVIAFGVITGRHPEYLPMNLLRKALRARPEDRERE